MFLLKGIWWLLWWTWTWITSSRSRSWQTTRWSLSSTRSWGASSTFTLLGSFTGRKSPSLEIINWNSSTPEIWSLPTSLWTKTVIWRYWTLAWLGPRTRRWPGTWRPGGTGPRRSCSTGCTTARLSTSGQSAASWRSSSLADLSFLETTVSPPYFYSMCCTLYVIL